MRDLLRAHNTACAGATCPLAYVAIIDSQLGPDRAQLDATATEMCTAQGLCTYEQYTRVDAGLLHGRRTDASCATWHAAQAPATAWLCNDPEHVQTHHLGARFLLRMGLTDELVSSNMIEAGFIVPGRGPLTTALFAELVRARLLALPSSTPEEPFAAPPAVFGPPCSKHETLSSNPSVYDTTVSVGGTPRTMFDILGAFVSGGTPTTAVWSPGDPVDCP